MSVTEGSSGRSFRRMMPVASRAAKSGEQVTHRAELVQRVERRNLVDLGERRVVEDALDEEVDRAAEPHHGLADVDDLRRVRAERVDAEQAVVLRRDEQLHETVGVAEDLPARELSVVRDADLVRDRRLRELELRLADEADLRDREDAEGELPDGTDVEAARGRGREAA